MLVAAAGCAPADEQAPAPAATGLTNCSKDQLTTKTPGKLTIGTDDPAYEPWFKDNKPDNGQGFESAVAYAVAGKLGYGPADVKWIRVTFNNAIAPGPKDFDIDINQFSITDERKQAVDFSGPYYLVRQTVIALKSSKIAGATSVSALQGAKLGAQVGTTSYQAITDLVKPTAKPAVYNSNDDAKKALQNGQIDGLVVDLPTAFYMTAAEIKDSVIVGQLPQVGVPEQFGIVLDKGSALTGCITQAVDQLRSAGTLSSLEKEWLAQAAGARELT
ncbi:amino acid ABC transporter substrate-binding protein [Phytohabitans rumicis]|uniref:Amino acid ABC transporter substrate-binding protein n=1 Tax=Phytohabitans rumicis TaxID=1076125 RepID=A0A6V8KVY9_9ACTN|nr:amino acid ABC transporter substrate-binding protein [Phytohabitans rumicis]